MPVRRILLTGAEGFIGRNMALHLGASDRYAVLPFVRGDSADTLAQLAGACDAVIHLAGENRPDDPAAFDTVNRGLTDDLCRALADACQKRGQPIPLVLASSLQAARDNPYGQSKRAAEAIARRYADETGSPVHIFRLPGVFGKWCRPDYNSVVATFCHNIARGLPIRIDDPDAPLRLVYVDDVVAAFLATLDDAAPGARMAEAGPVHDTTVGALAEQIRAFEHARTTLMTERVGTGFVRALYATYISYLPAGRFSYAIPAHHDPRGAFVEMLKTPDCGQFSFLTAAPGVTRGGHYHHTKTEKFLVVKGDALFRFRHLLSNERVELRTSGAAPQVVETIPGWAHDITNIGDDEMIVMLWANEVFDRARPDTVSSPLW